MFYVAVSCVHVVSGPAACVLLFFLLVSDNMKTRGKQINFAKLNDITLPKAKKLHRHRNIESKVFYVERLISKKHEKVTITWLNFYTYYCSADCSAVL